METLPPDAPAISGVTADQNSLRLNAEAYALGLKLSGTAPGASLVEVTIGNATTQPHQAFVNSSGEWTIQISTDQLPSSKTQTSQLLTATAINRHGARSENSSAPLLVDTATPTIESLKLRGDQLRIVFDEAVTIPSNLDALKFNIRSGNRGLDVLGMTIENNDAGNTELILTLNKSPNPELGLKLSYSGTEIADATGNQLQSINNRFVEHVLVNASVDSPHYTYRTIELSGSDTSVSSTLSSSDFDTSATSTWSIEGSPSTTYGSINIDANTGEWTYTLNNNSPETQALEEGDSVTESFIARVTDDNDAFIDQTITVTIDGTNNEPIVTTAFDLSGNDYSNTIIGNSADNILSGGNGPDTITGQEGRDTFQINSLNESKLWDSQSSSFAYDIITDFEIGKDIIDAPYQVASSDIVRVSDPTAIELSKDLLSNLLPADVLPAYGAAIVSLTASNDDYLILNNYRAGFKSTTDSVIEISNYIGDLDDLMII